jgi:ACT domain-containing protein
MKKEKNKKAALLDAFDQSETKRAAEACKIAGVALSTFYWHQYKDANFRLKVLEKQRDHLSARIASV